MRTRSCFGFRARDSLKSIFIVLLLLACSACGGLKIDSAGILTNQTVRSDDGKLLVKIPAGWFAAEDNENNATRLWLIKDDYSATIGFTKLNFVAVDNEKDNLARAVEYSKAFVRSKNGIGLNGFFDEELFELNGKNFKAYKYKESNNSLIRVVVFFFKEEYFESIAVSTDGTDLAELQNAVLFSIN